MSARRLLVVCTVVLLGAILLVVLRAGSRGGGDRPGLVVEGAEFPLRVRSGEQVLVLERAPRRVLPAFASAVDFVVDLLPRERVAALPYTALQWSALAEDAGGWDELPVLHAFSAEEILALSPDLVLVQSWLGAGTIDTLRRKGVPVLDLPIPGEWNAMLDTVRALGAIFDARARAAALVDDLERRRLALAARGTPPLRALCYTNYGSRGTTAGRDSTGDLLLELAGLRNAAAEIGLTGIPSIDYETILALAPDVFVVGAGRDEAESPSALHLLGEPKVAALEAVQERRVVVLPMHLFNTASHRLIDAAEALADAVATLPAAGAK